MSSKSEELLASLQRVLAELEALAHEAGEAAGEGAEEAKDSLRDALAHARNGVEKAEARLGEKVARGARTTDAYVRENPWVAIGVAALFAYLVGTLTGGRRAR